MVILMKSDTNIGKNHTNYVFHKSSNHSILYECELFSCEAIYISYCPPVTEAGYFQPTYHSHPNYELHYVLSGSCEIELEDKTIFKISKNQFILIPPHLKHRITDESIGFSKLASLFSLVAHDNPENSFYKTAELIAETPVVKKPSRYMKQLSAKIIEFARKKPTDLKNSLLFAFMAFITDMFRVLVGTHQVELRKRYNDKRFDDAINYINENVSEKLTVNDVANYIHISKKQLERLFDSILKQTPGTYIKNQRALRIRNLLLKPELSLDDIAEIMGYNNVSSMIKFYKRIEGNTPQQFRKAIYKD